MYKIIRMMRILTQDTELGSVRWNERREKKILQSELTKDAPREIF